MSVVNESRYSKAKILLLEAETEALCAEVRRLRRRGALAIYEGAVVIAELTDYDINLAIRDLSAIVREAHKRDEQRHTDG